MLDGLGRIDAYVERAKKLGMTHMGLTDHGSLMGAPSWYRACKDNGLNALLGIEHYFVESVARVKEEKIAGERFHVVMLARNEAGFRTLTDLTTEAHRNFYRKPIIDRAILEQLGRDAENLTVLSGCAGSIISKKALTNMAHASEEIEWWTSVFPNFYIELQQHFTDFDKKLNLRLVRLAKRHKLDWVVTGDSHFVHEHEADPHSALLAIQTASDIDDPNRFKFDGHGYHLKGYREMKRDYAGYKAEVWDKGAANTMTIARDCNLVIPDWDNRSWHIPKFPKAKNSFARLKRQALRGLAEKGLADKPEYVTRMNHELAQFQKAKMADFLLITADLVQEGHRRGFRTSPGRGSVAGTLVGFLIGIHNVDSVKYGLIFERFLNPSRPKMPDIDTDFPPEARDEMFAYAQELYGADNVMHLAAFGTLQTKRAFQTLGKAYGIPYQERLRLSALMTEDEEGKLLLAEEIREGYPDLVETLDHLVGLKASIASHPAGVLIFSKDDPIRKLVPEMWVASSKKMVAQIDLKGAEALGLMKQDILGLRTLATVTETVRLVSERHGVELDPDSWVPDEEQNDKAVYRMLARGKTAGVFQLEGGACARGIQAIGCDSFASIVHCTSLFRAGPIIAGAPKRYLANKAENRSNVMHPSLKPYLSETWGEMLYQESFFAILNELAGFSWARVDDAKTAMTRKDAVKMNLLKDEAIAGFTAIAGMSAEKALEVWETMAAQAGYIFNKAHATGYSLLSYITARLKYLYPLEYIVALLRTVEGKSDAERVKRDEYLSEACARGFKVLPPDIKRSDAHMTCAGAAALRFGLVDIKGVGDKAAAKIVPLTKTFKSLADVEKAANNKGVMAALSGAGALECFGVKTTPEVQEQLLQWQFHDVLANFREKLAKKMRKPKTDRAKCLVGGQIVKVERRKTKTKKDFVTWQVQWLPGESWGVTLWSEAADLWDLEKGSVVSVEGRWSAQWSNIGVGDSQQVNVLHAVRTPQ